MAGAIITPLRHPLALAKDLATLDRLSQGRLIVLPTVSWHRDEYEALGVPFDQRGELLDEQLEIWRRVWSGSPVSFDGRHYRFGDVWVEHQPYRPGGSSVHPRLIRRLVRYGTGFNPLGQPEALPVHRRPDQDGRVLRETRRQGVAPGLKPRPAPSSAPLAQAAAGCRGVDSRIHPRSGACAMR